MKIVIIHGQNHKGSTYHIAHELAEKIGGDLTEFFLPKDFGEFCLGCINCFTKDEKLCPHYNKLLPITEALDTADVIILASPVYVFHVTGQMKAFLDHYGYRWMVHSPEGSMFTKQAVCITTAAGAGTRSALKDLCHSTLFWGVGRTYKYGTNVFATNWSDVSDNKKKAISKATDRLANKVINNETRVKPSLKIKCMFYALRLLHKKGIFPKDAAYWKDKGWTEKVRPWN